MGAYAPGSEKEIAHTLFDILDYRQLEPLNLYVDEKVRGQGIARIMYDYVKSKGYAIHRSWDQTDAGAGFWDKHRGEDRVWEGLAQDEAQEMSGWVAELINEINYNTFEVGVFNIRSKESANYVVRPVDMIDISGQLQVETMDVRDLQTGQTQSWTTDDPAPQGPIAYAISSLFYDDPALQKKLWNIIDRHQSQGQDMMPGLDQRRAIGQEVDADAWVDSHEKTQDAMSRMKRGVAENRLPRPSQGQGKYRDLNAPLGPEFKPTMPRGTVRVDVSDVYDWYKLGKHIPNLDRADPGEFEIGRAHV